MERLKLLMQLDSTFLGVPAHGFTAFSLSTLAYMQAILCFKVNFKFNFRTNFKPNLKRSFSSNSTVATALLMYLILVQVK